MSESPDHPALARLARLEEEWDVVFERRARQAQVADDEPLVEVPVFDLTPAAPSRPIPRPVTAGPGAVTPGAVAPRPAPIRPTASGKTGRPRMGYQPALDGVRAISVIAVILYHAGFEWMHGGFFGVEVFFVVSGFLITSLLIEERDRTGGIALAKFWQRRFRRLLPALAAMLVVVGVWAVFWGSAERHSQLRRDYPWSIFYMANWGQIFSDAAYFTPSPGLFRHLWSLAVEEQWYALWPLAFVAITRRRGGDDRRRGIAIAGVAVAVMVFTALAAAGDWPSVSDNPSFHVNFLYLSTFTRSSGLLLGAALAFLWRPWKVAPNARGKASSVLDGAAAVAVAVLLLSFFIGRLVEDSTYLYLLPLVTIASTVLVASVVHPWAVNTRRILGSRPLVEIGKRSYGLYLWSWPVSLVCEAHDGSWSRFAVAMLITVPVNEVCYRFIEGPIRSGVITRWWDNRHATNWRGVLAVSSVSAVWMAGSMVYFFTKADAVFDKAADSGADLVFDAGAITGGTDSSEVPTGSSVPSSDPGSSVVPEVSTTTTLPTSTTLPTLPRKLVIVGDSTAHALKINLPAGIETTFTVGDGAISGCSVYSSGTAKSSIGYTRKFSGCGDWTGKWLSAAQEVNAEVALVVLGAWDVFDVEVDGATLPFASAENDARFLAGLQQGIDAFTAAGIKVALLEVPCMRPQNVEGQGTPPLPERGDDARVAHVNELLRQAAANNPATTTFVTGAQEYCTDPTIASSLAYRWDGVHSYKPGAKLTIEAIAAQLLAIPYP